MDNKAALSLGWLVASWDNNTIVCSLEKGKEHFPKMALPLSKLSLLVLESFVVDVDEDEEEKDVAAFGIIIMNSVDYFPASASVIDRLHNTVVFMRVEQFASPWSRSPCRMLKAWNEVVEDF